MVNHPYTHEMMPTPTHDEDARQQHILAFKCYMTDNVYPKDVHVYEKVAKPKFERENRRAPKDRHEVRKLMEQEFSYQWWSTIARTLQEQMWDNVGEIVERQLPSLISKAKAVEKPKGTLKLNPAVTVPRYNSEIDIHCMPGGYHTEITDDDVYAGALFDRGAYYHVMGMRGAKAFAYRDEEQTMFLGAPGRSIIGFVKQQFPDLKPRRVLDMGCAIGGGLLAHCDAWPEAEIYGIDVSAPQLRYGHARAEALGKVVHFIQMDAEHTSFPDGHFDLIVSNSLLHETSRKAVRNIMKECFRLLTLGGIAVHLDPQFNLGLTPHDAFMHDWDTYYNAEPFWSTLHDIHPVDLMAEGGFDRDKIIEALVTRDKKGGVHFSDVDYEESGRESRISGACILAGQK